ncbi:MAG: RNA polymerase sigma factor [Myxococcota bacterium]
MVVGVHPFGVFRIRPLAHACRTAYDSSIMDSLTDDISILERGLLGGHAGAHRLITYITPVIQRRVAQVLLGGNVGPRRNVREEVEDLVQEVFTTLFANDSAVLRKWDPEKGLSLRGFVGLVARRRANALLSARKRHPWWEEAIADDVAERMLGGEHVEERQILAKDQLIHALEVVAAGQSERGERLLRWLFVEGMTTEEVQERTAMSRASVYQWRSRLAKALREAVEQGEGS